MKKFCSFLLLLLATGTTLFAQENPDKILSQDPSEEIWGQKGKSNVSAQAAKLPPRDPNPIPTPVPFDGGIAFLIAAGALYGKKRLAENKKRKDK